MISGSEDSGDDRVPAEVYEELAAAEPAERAAIVVRLIKEHARGQLQLPVCDDRPAMLDGVCLGQPVAHRRTGARATASPGRGAGVRGVSLRGAVLQGARLRQASLVRVDLAQADLRGAALGEADLRGANLEGADLEGADLAGANLRGAALGGANLRGAMLEEADLRGAGLRFSQFQGTVLEKADLRRADLWGAHFDGAQMAGANLRRVVLREAVLRDADLSGVDLRGAELGKSDFAQAKLIDADLRGADLGAASFHGAVLKGAKLQGLDFSGCDIVGLHVSGAWLERARLSQAQFGGAIGEERDGNYDEARKGYLALERAFQDLGDYDASSWAYRRRRRMQKKEGLQRAAAARAQGQWRAAAYSYAQYTSDQLVEWLCDYGESIPRVLGSLLALYCLFTLMYGLTGSVVRITETPFGPVKVPTWNILDLATFSLLAISTSGSPTVDLLPRDRAVHFLTATEALLGIALTGLLGFVAGNRIRR